MSDAFPGLVLLLLLIALYFLPSMIAYGRDMKNSWSVFFLNLFFGWTAVGWVAALCWAVAGTAEIKDSTRPTGPAIQYTRPPTLSDAQPVRLDTSAIAHEVSEFARARGYEIKAFNQTSVSFARGGLAVTCFSEGDLLLFKRQIEGETK